MSVEGDDPRSEARPGTQAVERAIAILGLFRGHVTALGVSEIARAVDLNISTAHRLVRALVSAGYMEQEPTSERYRLGMEIAVLGRRALEQAGLDLAKPVLVELATATGESTTLGVRRGQEVEIIEQASSPQPLRFDHPVGNVINLHASAMGKALLAYSGQSPTTTVSALRSLAVFTTHTISSRELLADTLRRVAADGYAINEEERYAGVNAVAAPVLDAHGVARAAVGVQGPSVRLTMERMLEIAPLVRAAARQISDRIQRA